MLLLSGQNIVKEFGEKTLFHIEKLEINDGDRIGLIGVNGAGKTTLLHMIYGDDLSDAGDFQRKCSIAMIDQWGKAEGTIGGEIRRTWNVCAHQCYSGGEKTRKAIAVALSKEAPLLLADEPTTNLDIAGVEALEQTLQNYSGAVVLVSHDRVLLDLVCNQIWELENGAMRVFPGNYSAWMAQKERERNFAEFEYMQYQKEKKRLEREARNLREEAKGMLKPRRQMGNSESRLYKNTAAIQQGHVQNRSKAILSRVEQLEVKEAPDKIPQVSMRLGYTMPIVSQVAISVKDLSICYGNHKVLENASFQLPTGKRTVMIGKNGAGKTSLCERIVSGSSEIHIANGVTIGYFSQNHDRIVSNKTVLENVRMFSKKPECMVRNILIHLLFYKEDLLKKASVLSGGERARLTLAQLLASEINLLILDEPTNHIDLYTSEALEKLLDIWEGTLLVITHDRRLAEKVAQRLLFVEDGNVYTFEGNWNAHQESLCEKKPKDDQKLLLQMRMATLSARMAALKKGDDLESLQREWDALVKEYQTLG